MPQRLTSFVLFHGHSCPKGVFFPFYTIIFIKLIHCVCVSLALFSVLALTSFQAWQSIMHTMHVRMHVIIVIGHLCFTSTSHFGMSWTDSLWSESNKSNLFNIIALKHAGGPHLLHTLHFFKNWLPFLIPTNSPFVQHLGDCCDSLWPQCILLSAAATVFPLVQ